MAWASCSLHWKGPTPTSALAWLCASRNSSVEFGGAAGTSVPELGTELGTRATLWTRLWHMVTATSATARRTCWAISESSVVKCGIGVHYLFRDLGWVSLFLLFTNMASVGVGDSIKHTGQGEREVLRCSGAAQV